nr:HNH endonuclease domain-containing protein [Aneurinibacillus aneurinilyticus]
MAVRTALLKVYNFKCVYSGEPLDYEDLTIDHIIPESLANKPEKLRAYLDQLGITDDPYELNSIYNLVPAKYRINRQKSDDLLDTNFALTLIHLAKRKAPQVIEEIKKFRIKKCFSRSIEEVREYVLKTHKRKAEEIYDIVANDKEGFEEKRKVFSCENSCRYVHNSRRISLTAFLPCYPDLYGSCMVTFRSLKIRDAAITLNHDQILKSLFLGLNTDPSLGLRGFIVGQTEEEEIVYIQLANTRFPLTIGELQEFCNIVDDFSKEYLKELQEIEKKLGTYFFDKSKTITDGYRLLKVNRNLWRKMIDFACEFDYEKGDSQWNIFDKNSSYIKVYNAFPTEKCDEGHHVFLHAEQDENYSASLKHPDNETWIVWEGIRDYGFRDKLENINERKYWDALTTYNWLTKEFIPYVIYYYEKGEKQNSFWIRFKKEKICSDPIKMFDIGDYIYDGKVRKYRRLESIETREELLDLVEHLQYFYNASNQRMYMSATELGNIYKAVSLCLLYISLDEYQYINSKLGFTAGSVGQEISREIQEYVKGLKDGVINCFTIDLILRCTVVLLRDGEGYLNRQEIQTVVGYLTPLFERQNLLEAIQRLQQSSD